MEHLKNDNLSLLEAVVQNTEMGKNTLEQIVPTTCSSRQNCCGNGTSTAN